MGAWALAAVINNDADVISNSLWSIVMSFELLVVNYYILFFLPLTKVNGNELGRRVCVSFAIPESHLKYGITHTNNS